MCLHTWKFKYLWSSKGSFETGRSTVTSGYELSIVGTCESKLSPPQEQHILLTTEPSLQLLVCEINTRD